MIKKSLICIISILFVLALAGCEGTSYISEETTDEDVTPPEIIGVEELVVTIGDAVSYRQNVSVVDDMDPNPVMIVDTSGVDLSREGTYPLIYTATDASGNSTSVETTITIVPRSEIGLEEAYAYIDEILDTILTDDMSEYDRLYEVWFYIHRNVYVDVSYSDNYVDNAYYFLQKQMGNCHCYYAASRLFLERMGYMTIDVTNRDNADTNHYWNLVSVDGGETWYHFDPCGWQWVDVDGICFMVTDDFLVTFSYLHDFHSHDWDTELYPATPKEYFGDYDMNAVYFKPFSEELIEEAWEAKKVHDAAKDRAAEDAAEDTDD